MYIEKPAGVEKKIIRVLRFQTDRDFRFQTDRDFDIDLAVFSDVGTLLGLDDGGSEVQDLSDPRASVGVGLAYLSPFGPIRVDFAKALAKQDFDQTENFRFNFGARF